MICKRYILEFISIFSKTEYNLAEKCRHLAVIVLNYLFDYFIISTPLSVNCSVVIRTMILDANARRQRHK